jgi:hypothetical protein
MSDLELTEEEQAEADEQVRKVNEWLQSDEGKQAVRRASEKSRQSRLERSRKRREFMRKRFWIGR